MKEDIVCIYHSNDLDGQCSGAIVKHFHPDCQLIPYDHGRDFPWHKITEESRVFMVDISLPIKDMLELSETCLELIWIDHHGTSIDEAEKLSFNPHGLRKVGLAACELTWSFFTIRQIPEFIYLLGRYDVWDLKKNPDALPFNLSLRGYNTDLTTKEGSDFWNMLFCNDSKSISEFIVEGKGILRFIEQDNKRLMQSYSIETDLDGYKAIAINRQPSNSQMFASIWDNKKYDLMISFSRFKNKDGCFWKISLYTDKPEVDVSLLAKKYGEFYKTTGGGHKQAAGFVAPGSIENLPFKV